MTESKIRQLKALYREGFPEDSEEYADYFFAEKFCEDNVCYINTDDKIVSAAYVTFKKLSLFGRIIELPFIINVATLKEYRGRGYAREAIFRLIDKLKEYPFVALHPSEHSFYERLGFVTVADIRVYDIASITLKERTADAELLLGIYRDTVSGADIFFHRDIADIEMKLREAELDGGGAYLADGGYVIKGKDVDEVCIRDDALAVPPLRRAGMMARINNLTAALEITGRTGDCPASIFATASSFILDRY